MDITTAFLIWYCCGWVAAAIDFRLNGKLLVPIWVYMILWIPIIPLILGEHAGRWVVRQMPRFKTAKQYWWRKPSDNTKKGSL